jgi:hypothetical protein
MIKWIYLEDLLFSDRRSVMSSLFKRPAGTGGPGKAVGKPVDERFEKKHPTLFDFLSQDTWPDGEARERATVILFAEGGTWKACLSDKTTQACLWATGDTFVGLLEGLEGRLTEDKPDWRPAKPKKK